MRRRRFTVAEHQLAEKAELYDRAWEELVEEGVEHPTDDEQSQRALEVSRGDT